MTLIMKSMEIQPMSEYSTVNIPSVIKRSSKSKIKPNHGISNISKVYIYNLGNLADDINNSVKYESKSIKSFSFIAGLNFFSAIPTNSSNFSFRKSFGYFRNYKRFKRGSRKNKMFIMNLKFFYNF